MEAPSHPSHRRWLWLFAFALVANPITLIGACSASFGTTNSGEKGIETMTVYERRSYRFSQPGTGDDAVASHPDQQGEILGQLTRLEDGRLRIDGGWMPTGGSANQPVTETIESDAVIGKALGSWFGERQSLVMAILVAPWMLGLAMLLVATRWADKIRQEQSESRRWWPLPVFLWGVGTLFYAWRMSRADRPDPG